MKTKFILIVLLFLIVNQIKAQDTTLTLRKLSLELVLGVNFNITHQVNLPGLEYKNISAGFSSTFFYESEYLIKVGIESGYFPVTGLNKVDLATEFGSTAVNAQLSTVPILLVFSMSYHNFYINFGRGVYLMFSVIDAFGENSRSNELVAGFNFGFSYKYPIYKNWKIGALAKFYYISDAGNSMIFSGIVLNYTMLNY